MNDTFAYVLVAAFSVSIFAVYVIRHRRSSERARSKLEENLAAGIGEPVTLHPSLDPNRCISAGSCVSACHEGKILGIINGRAALVDPTKCIGHGACAAACPVDAISLVFGTATRGVDIPLVRDSFETNAEGIYIAGELGGMGLIRNAVTQGRQAVENIAHRPSNDPSVYDVAIVGAGPAGLAATLQAESQGLRYVTIDQDDIGGTLLSYPRQKLVMTQPMDIPLYGRYKRREVSKEELLDLWQEIVNRTGVAINTFERLEDATRVNGHFQVTTTKSQYTARNILLAIGRRGTPRRLGVPGENLPNVTYRLLEPEQYAGKSLLVVGGGDSAVEAAVTLGEQPDARVTLSYRRDAFSRIKPDNRRRIENAASGNSVEVRFGTVVREIRPGSVCLADSERERDIDVDYTLVFAGGEMPTPFLKRLGVEIETKFGEQ
jgi:putative YpdA family bacillithiol system oxidoreductase